MKMTEKDKNTIFGNAITLEYALACARAQAEENVDIGKALGHAQAVVAELVAAGFVPEDDLEITEKDKRLILSGAITLEYALAEASENNVDIGKALGHAQAILAELTAAGFVPKKEKPDGYDACYMEEKKMSNTVHYNTGYHNTGDHNTGDWNSGRHNTGDCNTGDCNTGDFNTGDFNTGDFNSGDFNTGDFNSGDFNTGDFNSGHCNTGHHNTGDYNTGDWNKSSQNSGCFNTIEPKILLFNKPSTWTYRDWQCSKARRLLNRIPENIVWVESNDMTDEEKAEYPTHEITGGYLKVLDESERTAAAVNWWNGLEDEEKAIIMEIPNFDKLIFKEITGIDVDSTPPAPSQRA